MKVPFLPMSPILIDGLPTGEEWRYQLKWDGMRIIAVVEAGKVVLLSKNMHQLNEAFPELVEYLQQRIKNDCILDGEVVILDPQKQRPDFHLLLKRLRVKNKAMIERFAHALPITYVLFDLLSQSGQDLRAWTFNERSEQLWELFSSPTQTCLVTDTFTDGQALWEWVKKNEWEGVVSKRALSRYHEGKRHNDWYKTKLVRAFNVVFVGYMCNEGRLASLIMCLDDVYCGKVSAGLDQRMREHLRHLPTVKGALPIEIPPILQKQDIYWFSEPLHGVVTSMEMTEMGILRQPKLVHIEGITSQWQR